MCRIMSPSVANLKNLGIVKSYTVKRKLIYFFLLFYFYQGRFYYPESDVWLSVISLVLISGCSGFQS